MAILLWVDEEYARLANEFDQQVLAQYLALEFDATISETHSVSAQVAEHPVEVGSAISDNVRPMPRSLTLDGLITNTPLNDAVLTASKLDARVNTENAAPLTLLDYPRVIQIDTQRQLQPGRVILPAVSPFKFPGIKRASSPAQAFAGTWVTDSQFLASRLKGSQQGSYKQDRVQVVSDILEGLCLAGTVVQVCTELKIYRSVVITDVTAPVKPEDALVFSLTLKDFRTTSTQTVDITKTKKPAQKRQKPVEPQGPTGTGHQLTDEERARSDVARIINIRENR